MERINLYKNHKTYYYVEMQTLTRKVWRRVPKLLYDNMVKMRSDRLFKYVNIGISLSTHSDKLSIVKYTNEYNKGMPKDYSHLEHGANCFKFYRRTTTMNCLIVNFKTKFWYYRDVNFNRDKCRKRGQWKVFMMRNPFRRDDMSKDMFDEVMTKDARKIIEEHLKVKSDNIFESIAMWFAREHNMVLPDNPLDFLRFYPGIKSIKKCPNLVEAILKKYGTWCKSMNSMVQRKDTAGKPYYNIGRLMKWYKILGIEALRELSHGYIKPYSESDPFGGSSTALYDIEHFNEKDVMTKRNALKFARLSNIADEHDLRDHLRQVLTWKERTGKIWIIRATTAKSFKAEHLELSRGLRRLSSRDFKLEFSKEFEEMEKITINGWTPYLMRCRDDYLDEGEVQNNCVFGYRDRYNRCFIVSLRKNDKRITCQFDYDKKLVQTQERFNSGLGDETRIVSGMFADKVKKLNRLNPPKAKFGEAISQLKSKELTIESMDEGEVEF